MSTAIELRSLIKQLIQDTIAEQAIIQSQSPNEQGTVTSVNGDGTINVQTKSGTYANCGTPVQRTLGQIVTLLTADGKKVAV